MIREKSLLRGISRLLLLALAFSALSPSLPAHAAKKAAKKTKQKTEQTTAQTTNAAASQDKFPDDPDLEKERAIGKKALEQIEQQWPLASNPAVIARLNMILNRLEPHMERRIPWEIRLVTTEALNAFCLPGGFIFFTTGILDLLKTDSEIAAVMAHEMIHADRRHSLRMAAESNKVTLAALAVMLLSGGAAAPIILAQVAQVAITNAYTIELENEADRLGLDTLIASGYSPTGMVTLMERFMGEELKQPIRDYGIYMDHPSSQRRLAATLATLKERGIPVTRKYSLGLLRTAFHETRRRTELTVDDRPVWGGKRTPETREALEKVKAILDSDFQLETAPYDIHLRNGDLHIGNRLLTRPVEGMDGLDTFRQNLLKALDAARRRHPTAKYFQ